MQRTPTKFLWTRRRLLATGPGWLAGATLAGSSSLVGCGSDGPACLDPNTLSSGERRLREGQGYVDRSTTRGPDGSPRVCGGCQFFSAAPTAEGCGHCQILGGPVSGGGHCKAWADRQAG